MKILNLIIKQVYFDEIMAGSKVQEFREVKPTTVKKYIQIDEEGYQKEDEDGNSVPIEYDAIRFFVGYNKDRDSALVKLESAYTEMFVDENDEFITYQYGIDENDEPLIWYAEQIVYNLGEILEKNIHKKGKG